MQSTVAIRLQDASSSVVAAHRAERLCRPLTGLAGQMSRVGLSRSMIRFARTSLISRCRGTGSEFPVRGLWQISWRPPSRSKTQPIVSNLQTRSRCFTRTPAPQPSGSPDILGAKEHEQVAQVRLEIGEIVALRPVVGVVVQEAEAATVRFLPVCEACLHDRKRTMSDETEREAAGHPSPWPATGADLPSGAVPDTARQEPRPPTEPRPSGGSPSHNGSPCWCVCSCRRSQ